MRKLTEEEIDTINVSMCGLREFAEKFAEAVMAKMLEVNEHASSDHPKAPHGFNRNASHSEDRYVCECESWDPYSAGYDAGYVAGYEAGMDQAAKEPPQDRYWWFLEYLVERADEPDDTVLAMISAKSSIELDVVIREAMNAKTDYNRT